MPVKSQEHHTIDRLEDSVLERGSPRLYIPSLNRRKRAIVNQTNIGTVSKAALGKRLRETGYSL